MLESLISVTLWLLENILGRLFKHGRTRRSNLGMLRFSVQKRTSHGLHLTDEKHYTILGLECCCPKGTKLRMPQFLYPEAASYFPPNSAPSDLAPRVNLLLYLLEPSIEY
ncbi:hypothetical protein B0H16DRAFT_884727 [Mycena metata]|uniref:Uncharacterized protein n=1 Tax=Mycena metata TaxID=1033252 RepID=A0AAD7GL70_9AGAR|nr:hypothetical protein B0H16DRAFT_843477 [Mycena metata]KAJ7778349.1 hypothetical protein B0H16DRAFT_884727 [Mycena metata]